MARSSALRAITAIAQKEDTVRKLIIEASIVQYIFDSLKPLPDSPIDALFSPNETSTDLEGNPTRVLVAACTAVTALARSVSILRTSLIDLKIAKPIFDLLRHPNLRVKQASTDTMINLLLPFSPVRTVSLPMKLLSVSHGYLGGLKFPSPKHGNGPTDIYW
jgi:armadillo repeat-containing protein 8